MPRLKVYLDTSVINFVHAEDSPDFQRVTNEFFDHHAVGYELYISDIVRLEISRCTDPTRWDLLNEVIEDHDFTILDPDGKGEIVRLANLYIQSRVVPAVKMEDALHVAYATFYEMDILLSWNFKHLANVNKEAKIQVENSREGYRHPLRLTSPMELIDDQEG